MNKTTYNQKDLPLPNPTPPTAPSGHPGFVGVPPNTSPPPPPKRK